MSKINSFYIILILILLINTNCIGQKKSNFKVFYSPDKYTASLQSLLINQNNFKEYRLMIQAYIDPKNSGNVDKALFVNSINKFYPDPNVSAVLCIDLENKLYKNLVSFNANSVEFQEAKGQFLWMVTTVKKMRPNVEVGFYGLPIRTYYANSKNVTNKFDEILSASDYIFPSLYTMYPNSQVGKARNEKYLKENLESALDYGVRLKRPVVPFMWNLVHPSNKLYGGQLVSKEEFLQNLKFIKKIKYKNQAVMGVVWWDPDHKSFARMIKTDVKIDYTDPKFQQSKLLVDYLKSCIEIH